MVGMTQSNQWRATVGSLDEALELAGTQARKIDAWSGISLAISAVNRDHMTGQFQWEVMVSGQPLPIPEAEPGTVTQPPPPAE